MRLWPCAFVMMIVCASCDEDSDDWRENAPVCNPGEKRDCVCNTGAKGQQICHSDGLGYSPCVCVGKMTVDAGIDAPIDAM
jgi:hypothetical protein